MSVAAPVKWSAFVVAAFVLSLAAYFLKDAYERVQARGDVHENRIQAEERTTAVTALQLTLMQKQLDRIESKLDVAVARR